jgi:hypothetical protein
MKAANESQHNLPQLTQAIPAFFRIPNGFQHFDVPNRLPLSLVSRTKAIGISF